MKKLYIYLLSSLIGCFAVVVLYAQPNTMYFMNYLPYQSYMNPAIQPACRVYVELPAISAINFSLGNNSLSMNDFVYMNQGQMVTALHPELGDKTSLLNAFSANTKFYQDLSFSLLGFGFKIKENGYLSINASLRQDMAFYIPKDFVKLALYGTPEENQVNTFNLQSLGFDASAYMDLSAGYSHKINEQFTVGLRAKLLVGLLDANLGFNELELQASQEEWRIIGNASARFSAPTVTVLVNNDGMIEEVAIPDDVLNSLTDYRPNLGLGFDLGAVYKPIENLSLSVAIRDLGFISWKNGYQQSASIDFAFEGIEFDITQTDSDYADSLLTVLQDSYTVEEMKTGYTSMLKSKIYLGAEYAFLNNKMSVGLLSKTTVENSQAFGELTASLNMRPLSWFGTSFSYSLFNGNFSSMGIGVNLRIPPFSFYIAGDYFPLYFSSEMIPYKMRGMNMQTGMVMTFGCKKKKIKEVQEEDKSTKMLRLQQEMMLLQQEMDKGDDSKVKKEEDIYTPVQRMQDPTGILQQTNNEQQQLTPQQLESIETTINPIVGETDNLTIEFEGVTTTEENSKPADNVEGKDDVTKTTTSNEAIPVVEKNSMEE
ncbi:MAG: hypothetical protein KBD91_04735 [Paludibacteraceae bacterium]|nr:hypothetical protein [Paludibacteraceae bacterium]